MVAALQIMHGRMTTTARRIREVRKRLGLKQEDFAALLKVSQTSISRWEKGSQEPDIMMLMEIGRLSGSDPVKFALYPSDEEFKSRTEPEYVTLVGGISATTQRDSPRWEEEDYLRISVPLETPKGHWIEAYLVEDDSCEPKYPKGTILFVALYNRARGFYPKNDDICLIYYRNENGLWINTIKSFRWDESDRIELTGIGNSMFQSYNIEAAVVLGNTSSAIYPMLIKNTMVAGLVIGSFMQTAINRLPALEEEEPESE